MKVLLPDPAALAETGFAGMSPVPILFDSNHDFREAENRFLRERAHMAWPLAKPNAASGKDRLAPNTLLSIAWRLQHFAEWREHQGLKLSAMTYSHVRIYEAAQKDGLPPYPRALSATTATLRADTATDFLAWASHRNLCPAFHVDFLVTWRKVQSGQSSVTPWAEVRSRPGRSLKPERRPVLKVPEIRDIARWLVAVRRQRGTAKYLICRFIVQTGVRLDEAVSLRERQWPSRDEIRKGVGGASLLMTLTKTKGMVMRTISVPHGLAERVRDWIDHERLALTTAAMDRVGSQADPDRLFLSDREGFQGMPIERHTVYDCFREVRPRPEGWHPHKARHAYTCHYVRAFVLTELNAAPSEKWPQLVQSRGEFAIQTLRSQLGHVSDRTTQIYLRYLRSVFGLEKVRDEFHDLLDSEEDE